MKTKLIASVLVAATAAVVALSPAFKSAANVAGPALPPQHGAHKVEVVFVLDTTSSMTGLIQTAKEKIWSIASTLAQAEQTPEVRMGIVAFRDRGDAYVTRVVDLSTDLDSMYATLRQLAAEGGGDGPEDVNRALGDAVHEISWSQDPSSYRVIFLVGDAPPHMDYAGEPRYPEIVAAARARGIVVNTIQCGRMAHTQQHWSEIARLGGGRYMQVEQSGGAFAVATPYDDQIARLAAELDETRVVFGRPDEREAFEARRTEIEAGIAGASTEALARRGVFNAVAPSAADRFGGRDLVSAYIAGDVDLDALDPTLLPEPVAELAPGEQAALIEALAAKRTDLERRIRALGESRAGFIDAAAAESDGAADDSLDRQIYDAVREQAAGSGLRYEKGPAY